jgi:hypothetical protein
MTGFIYRKIAGQRDMKLSPEKVGGMLRAMLKRPSWEGVIVSPNETLGESGKGQVPRISIEWFPNFGYQVHVIELGIRSHFVATSENLSQPEVYVELGGQGQELWPPEMFVALEIAEQAIQYLLESSKRDPALKWIAIDGFNRASVKPRKLNVRKNP